MPLDLLPKSPASSSPYDASPHNCRIAAPPVRKICVQRCKKDFFNQHQPNAEIAQLDFAADVEIPWLGLLLLDGRLGTVKHKVQIAMQEFSILFEINRHWWFAPGPRIVSDIGVSLEVKLRGKRHMQYLWNSEMDVGWSHHPRVFLQARKFWRDRVSSRHNGFELIIPLLIRQHHASQVEGYAFREVTGLFSVVLASAVRLPNFN